jgi:muconolactone D-isomerase
MSMRQDFLVRIDIDTAQADVERVNELCEAEARRAAELASSGHLTALWRVPDAWANYGVWHARDSVELHRVLDSLPLRPYMSVTVQPLCGHPNDPRRANSEDSNNQVDNRSRPRWILTAIPELTIKRRAGGLDGRSPRLPQRQRAALHLEPLAPLKLRRRTRDLHPLSASTELPPAPQPTSTTAISSFTSIEAEVSPAKVTGDEHNEVLLGVVASCTLQLLREHDFLQVAKDGVRQEIDLLIHPRGHPPYIVERADRLTDKALAAALSQPPTAAPTQTGRPPVLELTHSGGYGLRSYLPRKSDAWFTLDVGALTRQPVVRTLPNGGEGVGTRSAVLLTLGTRAPHTSLHDMASLLQALRSRLIDPPPVTTVGFSSATG